MLRSPSCGGKPSGAWFCGSSGAPLETTTGSRGCCDDWEQASHGGDLAQAVSAGSVSQDDVTKLGAVLSGETPGRQDPDDITAFDSTGLAIQDLAVALAPLEQADEPKLQTLDL